MENQLSINPLLFAQVVWLVIGRKNLENGLRRKEIGNNLTNFLNDRSISSSVAVVIVSNKGSYKVEKIDQFHAMYRKGNRRKMFRTHFSDMKKIPEMEL
uniref:Uncharacterized protein n=1 Tax=Strongyloides venezuelensis TaxID=75913 RepID=A0A0K0EVT6_STRVS